MEGQTSPTQKSICIAVGSTNPSKISSVEIAFKQSFPSNINIIITTHSVPSNVSDQPVGDKETKEGAKNRAMAAFHQSQKADFGVGLEGGIEYSDDGIWCMAWMAIVSNGSDWECKASDDNAIPSPNKKEILCSYSKTAAFLLPPQISTLVKSGMELGDADDQVFQRVNSKHRGGTVGILTNGLIDRSLYYDHAIKLALIPWIRPSLYFQNLTPMNGCDEL